VSDNPIQFSAELVTKDDKELYLELVKRFMWKDTPEAIAEVMESAPVIFDTNFMVEGSPLRCFLVKCFGFAVGFTVLNIQDSNWSLKKSCFIEVLYIEPAFRGDGYGAKTIEFVKQLGLQENWCRIHWTVCDTNQVVQSVYNEVGERQPTVIYEIDLTKETVPNDCRRT
jgi:GNAT superfamily N-acetyltransferase